MKEREQEILERLRPHQEAMQLFSELLTVRRERHRDKLEKGEDSEVRGRAKECKDLIQVLVDSSE